MAQFRVDISHTERFRGNVIVDASSPEEARKKVEQAWQDSEYLYEKVTDYAWDMDTQFDDGIPATDTDYEYGIHID